MAIIRKPRPQPDKIIIVPKRGDYPIRRAIVSNLLKNGFDKKDIRQEITLDTNSAGGRADMVLFMNGCIRAVEIKSAQDNLDRLENQMTAQVRRFDSFHTILDIKHREKLKAIKHSWRYNEMFYDPETPWACDLQQAIPYKVSYRAGEITAGLMLSLLWRSELQAALDKKTGATRTGMIAWAREHMTIAEIRKIVIEQIREREHSKWELKFWETYDHERNAATQT